MATLRQEAQDVLTEARDGIAWIAIWKDGRGWCCMTFWPDVKDDAPTLGFDDDETQQLVNIAKLDAGLSLNSYYQTSGASRMNAHSRTPSVAYSSAELDLVSSRRKEQIMNRASQSPRPKLPARDRQDRQAARPPHSGGVCDLLHTRAADMVRPLRLVLNCSESAAAQRLVR